jgi:MscS family membrane protein
MVPPLPASDLARSRRGRPALAAAVLAGVIVAAAATAAATPPPSPHAGGNGSAAAPSQALTRATPRDSIAGFLAAGSDGEFGLAAQYLDLSGIAAAARAAEGPRLARRLFLVIIRRAPIDAENVSNEPLGSAEAGVEPRVEELATLELRRREAGISLELVAAADGSRAWVISRDTVKLVDALYRAHGYGLIGDKLPSLFFSLSFLGLQLWQWAALAVALLFGYGIARLVSHLLLVVAGAVARRTAVTWDDAVIKALDGPLAIVLWGLALTVTSAWVGLSAGAAGFGRQAWRLLTLYGVGWVLFRVWDEFADRIRTGTEERNRVMVGYIPIISRAGKIFISLVVLLAALDVLGVNVVGMLAGIGIGGIAIAFAAQKTIENIFGAATIAGDRPFTVGDYVTAGGVTGTVEEIGLRSTRFRTLDRTLVTVPNGVLAAGPIVNFAQRDRFLFNPTIGLRYETTADQMSLIIDDIRKALITHPKVFQDSHRVRFSGFGASALTVEIMAWIVAADYHEFTAIAEELNFAIARIVEGAGTSFAFPSQTLYMSRDDAPDRGRAESVTREVAERRERGELAVPEPPPGLVAKLRRR